MFDINKFLEKEKKKDRIKQKAYSILIAIIWLTIGLLVNPLVFNTKDIQSPSDFIKLEDLYQYGDDLCISGKFHIAFVSNTKSMDPLMDNDTILIAKNIRDVKSIKVGDIVAYNGPDNKKIVHRIIEVNSDGSLKLKGDNNGVPDGLKIDPTLIDSVVVGILY